MPAVLVWIGIGLTTAAAMAYALLITEDSSVKVKECTTEMVEVLQPYTKQGIDDIKAQCEVRYGE